GFVVRVSWGVCGKFVGIFVVEFFCEELYWLLLCVLVFFCCGGVGGLRGVFGFDLMCFFLLGFVVLFFSVFGVVCVVGFVFVLVCLFVFRGFGGGVICFWCCLFFIFRCYLVNFVCI
ncbi:hypothetical protein, partial [Klebsiella pneumoniae]|uniref:hypothetical protein n=1 Tax=Klebsiella pneumoniae TaxID=573 RepID=UPI001C8F7D76